MAKQQVWELTRDDHRHRLTATDAGLSRRLEWWVDDELVAEKKSAEERVQLAHDGQALDVRFTMLGRGRRATLHTARSGAGTGAARTQAELGVGGTDLVPEPGSGAARHEDWVRDHPRLHTLRETLGGAAGVVIGLVVTWLLARFAFSFDLPDIPLPALPDLPDIPWPDIPWPSIDLPSIPLPDWSLPGWVQEVLDLAKFVVPVLIAFVVARAEVRRRRKQDAERQAEQGPAEPPEH